MRRFACFLWVLSAIVCTSSRSFGQKTVAAPASPVTHLVEPPVPLLPTSDRLVAVTDPATLPPDKPELARVLAEDGLQRTESRLVVAPTAGASATAGWVRAYQFVDATGAESAYSYLRQGGRAGHSVSRTSRIALLPDGEQVLLSGVSVVRAQYKLPSGPADAILEEIETGLPKVGGRKGAPPLLPTLLPKPGLDEASIRYSLGPIAYQQMGGVLPPDLLGWDKAAEVATARYDGRGGRGTLTLLMYPTPEIAGDRGRAIQDAVNRLGPSTFGTVKLKRLGPMVEMTSGSFTPAQAQSLIDSVHLNQDLTYDKALPSEFNVEIKKTVTLLEAIALFVGIGLVAAVVLGVFLGGARAGIRVLQGKPAASEPEFLTIDLRGRPEPLMPSAQVESEGKRG